MNPVQIFEVCKIWIKSKIWKTNQDQRADFCSAHQHSTRWPTGTVSRGPWHGWRRLAHGIVTCPCLGQCWTERAHGFFVGWRPTARQGNAHDAKSRGGGGWPDSGVCCQRGGSGMAARATRWGGGLVWGTSGRRGSPETALGSGGGSVEGIVGARPEER
jgi:hypothetical protein